MIKQAFVLYEGRTLTVHYNCFFIYLFFIIQNVIEIIAVISNNCK